MTRAYLLDTDRSPLGRLDDSFSALATRRRYWAGDTFTMAIDYRRLYASDIAEGRFLYLPGDNEIYVIEQIQAERGAESDLLTVSGRGLDGFIGAERRAWPPAGQSHDRQTNVPAETAMKHYVDAHAGPGAAAARQIPGLVIAADQARGASVTTAARFHALDDVHREIGLVSGYGWQVTLNEATNEFVWDVVVGVDRSTSVFFDFKFETLEEWRRLVSLLDSKTWVRVAGQGEGVDREIVDRWSGAEPTGFARREAFMDARDVELGETTILQQRGDAFLASAGKERRFEATIHQFGSFRYGEHWFLGDIVLIRDASRGISEALRVVELETTHSSSGDAGPLQRVASLGRPFPTWKERVQATASNAGPIVDTGGGAGAVGDDLVYVGDSIGSFDLVRMGA